MRMRRKKNLDARIAALSHLLLEEPTEKCGDLAQLSGTRPIYIEVGCGKGSFITEMAVQNPDCLFVAVEKYDNVIVLAMERADKMGLKNILFLCADAAVLREYFAPRQISGLFINFCDPWPAKRHAKRRLTHHRMLAVFHELLASGGEVRLKTDDPHLFEFSLCELSQSGFEITRVSLDLHASGEDNVMTEYELKFSAMGMKILSLTARKSC